MQNIYTIKLRISELRKEIANASTAWADIPGGASNPVARADLAMLWRELEALAKEAHGVTY